MAYSKSELIQMYQQIVAGNTNIDSMSENDIKEFGKSIFHLIYLIDYNFINMGTYTSLFNIKDVGIHLMDYPEKMNEERKSYIRMLQAKFNQHHADILHFLNTL